MSPSDDDLQDHHVGDFRGYVRNLVSKSSRVLEIGPSYMPVFPRRDGYDVSIVDHANAPDLREKYGALNVNTSFIEDVDFVWAGEPLSELVQGNSFDVIFASHVVEHMTNFIQFINESSKLLSPGGKLMLIVPDKRFCFDIFQSLTDTAKTLEDDFSNASRHSLGALYREESQVTARYDQKDIIAWWQGFVMDVNMMRSDPISRYDSSKRAVQMTEYVDAHEYFFTPSSFYLIMEELRFLRMTEMKVELLTRARGCEFLVILERRAYVDESISRFQSMKKELSLNIMREQIEAWEKLAPLSRPIDRSFV
ncbi:class I SAM-dependent methyltransferase [Phyllobacterium sp. 628]|uniref:class I SAM-dependent methyltransferase n=1 Tax=Phyllobacterium sp. 628 TaxID=2718938 RepID=UPI0016626F95|nr:methyltransferase domain-containing protein [Phyllobacterium sp. 628]QND52682.1 class I SAM-dependent methyltransferase [Phyllobacterium sp. 628]